MDTIKYIIEKNNQLEKFWSNSYGWAPEEVVHLLNKTTLEAQTSLSECLKIWANKKENITSGELILAWTNLGALLENSMKLFLCIYLHNYQSGATKIKLRNTEITPDEAMLGGLISFYNKENLFPEYNDFFNKIRDNRNAIHSFKIKPIKPYKDFLEALEEYKNFLFDMNSRLPYPD